MKLFFPSSQATYSVETSKEKKTELWSAAVSWTGAGKKYVDVVTKKGKLTIKNPKATAIKCKIEHALQVGLISQLFFSFSELTGLIESSLALD